MISCSRAVVPHPCPSLGYHLFLGIATVFTARPCSITETDTERQSKKRNRLFQFQIFDLRHLVIKLATVIHGFVSSSFNPKSLNVAPRPSPEVCAIQMTLVKETEQG